MRFSREGNAQLLEATLCLLEVSNSGLLETELLEILKDIEYRPDAVESENSKGNFYLSENVEVEDYTIKSIFSFRPKQTPSD